MTALRRRYPQVEPGAASLIHRSVAICPPEATVRKALALIRQRRLRLLAVRDGDIFGVILPTDLARARALGLDARPVSDAARWGIPLVTPRTAEVKVRRLLLEGAPAILVRDGRRLAGAVHSSIIAGARAPFSLVPRLERQLPGETLDLLFRVGRVGEALGAKVYAVGGFVRDLLLGREPRELDIVVEGDGLALARRLAADLGSTLEIHGTFQTASLTRAGALRIDVATARRERYRAPGALPEVSPASLEEDLGRRDFSMNAMALALSPSGFGDLFDPFLGRADLARRRIRILHPLSFVEDPTRIFRAVRYQTRLGLSPDSGSRRAMRVASRIAMYPALSGQRLLAELELILAEPRPERSLTALGRLAAFRLLDPSYRFPPLAAKRVADLGALLGWLRERAIPVEPLSVALLALVGHLSAAVAERCLNRLALAGEPLFRLVTALREGLALAGGLARQREVPASARASLLRGHALETLGAAWLAGGGWVRRQVEWFLTEGRTIHPHLGGDDLLALGVAPGPRIGQLLERLRDRRLDGHTVTRDQELALVREWIGCSEPEEANCG
jgi:tRNA nucleotidyltransferase (CCA-adding enzyme)